MCQRKIIGKGVFRIVPILNGCPCPMVIQIRDIDQSFVRINCVDAKTELLWNNGNPVEWRFCLCRRSDGLCDQLPALGPISDMAYNSTPGTFHDIEDFGFEDDDFSLGGI